MSDPHNCCFSLTEGAVLARMIVELPETPWADIPILDWIPEDDKLPVEYSFAETCLGMVLVANTPKGVCYLGPAGDDPEFLSEDFAKRFRYATRIEKKTRLQEQAIGVLEGKTDEQVTLHLRGSAYQTEIWRRLVRIPYGCVISYATLGGSVRYARAAGTANGKNPIFCIVPCHRVVNSTGRFDRYFWGPDIKRRLLASEFMHSSSLVRD